MAKRVSVLLLFAMICASMFFDAVSAANPGPQPSAGQRMKTLRQFSDAERALIAASRKAIVQTGMSETYFDRHFTVVQAVNKPGDRRVVWKFSLNGHETRVTDVFGYYTQNGKRVDTHGVTTTLRATADIDQTISRRAANQIMRQCIGNFGNVSIEYRAGDSGGARFIMTAEQIPQTVRRRRGGDREREQREERERQAQSKTPATDPIEHEGEDRPPIITGTVDLQTGKCTKGQLFVTP
jgi:hypothetical protein